MLKTTAMLRTAMPEQTRQRVLVTGGAQRLGALICQQFAQAGWEVWCHYQQSGTQAQALCASLREHGAAAHAIQADLADSAQRQAMVHAVTAAGPLHCLVNNASRFEPDGATSLDMAAMRAQFEVNLLAPMELSALMAAQVPEGQVAGAASIIHLLDQKVFNLNPDYFSYTLTKLALERAVALQAQALAPKVRVCGVAPGLMFLSGAQTQDNFDTAARVNLMRQPIDPEQVAATCLFLAQNPCITGTTLSVDNGQHLVPLARDVMYWVDTPNLGTTP
jgi:NAD(P)-dependent dehydrogenase (short-subunit alcohol dehydrogenase family)